MAKSKASRAGAKNAGTRARKTTYGQKPARTAADVIAEARGHKSNLWYCIPAFIIPFVLTLISYACFDVYPFGERSVLTLDLNGQYIYYFEALRDAFWGDGSALYSWSRNLSGGFMGIIGYYLASPFTLIIMLLPRKMILESMMIMQMCKVGAAGAAFCVYAQKSKRVKPLPSVVFSTMYSMMSYVVIQLIDPMWIDGPIFLPLIILGVEYLIDDGRKINYIIPLAIMFVANFYIGFMIAIFVALYFVYYLFFGTTRKFKNINEYGKTFGVMVISTVVVLLCSAFMILPVYNALALGKFDFSDPDYSFQTMFKPLELLACLLPNQYYSVNVDTGTGYYGRPEIYCGVLTLVLVPLFFLNKKIKTNKKIGNALLLFIMFMSMYIKPLNMMWHGGQDPNWLPYRYSFIVSFLLVSMAAEVFANLDGYNLSLQATGGTFGLIAILVFIFEAKMGTYGYTTEDSPHYKGYKYVATLPYKAKMNYGNEEWEELWLGTLAIGVLLAAVYLLYIHFYSIIKDKKVKNILTCCVAAVVMFEAGYNCYDSFRKIYKEVGNSDKKSYTDIISAPEIVEKLENYDNGFYRAEKTYSRMVNDNLAYGLKGISHSSSVMNARAIKFIETMGYFTQSFESKYEGSNPVADSLLGIKYILDDPTRSSGSHMLDASYKKIDELTTTYLREDNQQSTVNIYENPNALSIGFMADDDIMRITGLGRDNPFNSLNNVLSAMTGNTADFTEPIIPKEYYTPLETEISFDETQVRHSDYVNNATPRKTVHDCYDALPGASDAVVNVHMTVKETGDVYMHLGSEMRKQCNVWVSDTKDENGNFVGHVGYGSYFTTNSSPIVRLGPFDAGTELEVRFTIVPTNGTYTGSNEYLMVTKTFGFNFYQLDRAAFEQDINILKENQWMIDPEKSNDRYLEGKITAKAGQVLVTTIPYEPGWTIEIDGKKVDSLILEETNNETGTTYLRNDNGDTGEVIVLGSLIGIRLPKGEHTVSMKYTPPGFNMGIFTLILGIAIIVMFYIYDRKHNPVLKARRKAREIEKLGIPTDTPESQIPEMKKKVQIIKSKGAVDSQAAEAAKKKAEKARAEEDKIKKQNEELLNKGKAYAEKAGEEAEKSQNEQASVKEEKPEKAVETKPKTSGQKPKKNSGNQNKNKGKNKKKK